MSRIDFVSHWSAPKNLRHGNLGHFSLILQETVKILRTSCPEIFQNVAPPAAVNRPVCARFPLPYVALVLAATIAEACGQRETRRRAPPQPRRQPQAFPTVQKSEPGRNDR
jgi:hypothetical protein